MTVFWVLYSHYDSLVCMFVIIECQKRGILPAPALAWIRVPSGLSCLCENELAFYIILDLSVVLNFAIDGVWINWAQQLSVQPLY